MFTSRVPMYTIDLDEEETDRWDEVIECEAGVAEDLVDRTEEDLVENVPQFIQRAMTKQIASQYQSRYGKYVDEMGAWADALGRPTEDLIAVNCIYELSHIAPALGIFGCTAGVTKLGSNLVHVRNLDWGISGIGDATRIFRFVKGKRQFVTIGIPGYVGALSGMLPKKYSLTMNWAPPVGTPSFDLGPSFLLREILEDCDSYDEALYALKHTELDTSVFFVLCGTKEACVVERTKKRYVIRKMKEDVLVQANHFVRLYDLNDQDTLDDSEPREEALEEALLNAEDLSEVFESLDTEDVLNDLTEQQMYFCPKLGEMRVWRWEE